VTAIGWSQARRSIHGTRPGRLAGRIADDVADLGRPLESTLVVSLTYLKVNRENHDEPALAGRKPMVRIGSSLLVYRPDS
jgi:hypothetical protein